MSDGQTGISTATGATYTVEPSSGITYILEPSATIPIEVASSISVDSTHTALPSATTAASQTGPTSQGRTVGIIIGAAVVGLALFSLVFWTLCFRRESRKRRRRRQRAPGSLSRRSPMGTSRPGSRSASKLTLSSDTKSGSTLDQSKKGPWVELRQDPAMSRKVQGERQGHRKEASITKPSRTRDIDVIVESQSADQHRDVARSAKPANLKSPEPGPARNSVLSSICSTGELSPTYVKHIIRVSESAPSPALAQFPSAQLSLSSIPAHHQYPEESIEEPTDDESQKDAKLSHHHEAWDVPRPSPGE